MLRKPLAVAAVGVALAIPSPAFAMHGHGEQATRVPKSFELRGSLASGVVVAAPLRRTSFSWVDAGIGASVTGAGVLVLVGGRRMIVRRGSRIRLHHAS